MPRHVSEDDIEEAVDAIMDDVDEHEYGHASGEVARSSSVAFYQAIITRCQATIGSLREALESEGEGDDEVGLDDEV